MANFAEGGQAKRWDIRAGIAEARLQGKHLGWPVTVGKMASQTRKLHRAGVSQADIARRRGVGRTSVQRILSIAAGTRKHP
jgi:DNA invertase Pin-like site-specific DNA recombinase